AGLHKLKKNFEDGNVDVNLVLTARPGLKPAALVKELNQRFQGLEVDAGGTPPQDVLLLQNVRTLPQALAVFLALLGLAALGHAPYPASRAAGGRPAGVLRTE